MAESERNIESEVPSLRDYGHTIWRYRRSIVAIALVLAVAAGVYSALQSRQYQATAQLLIQPGGASTAPVDAQTAARAVATEIAVLRSEPLKRAVAVALGHKPDVTVSNNGSNDVVNVTATSNTAVGAAADANAFAGTYVQLRERQSLDDLSRTGDSLTRKIQTLVGSLNQFKAGSAALETAQQQIVALQQELDQVQVEASQSQVGPASVLARASVPNGASAPKPIRNVAIALVLGLLIGVGVAFTRRYVGDVIHTREDLQRATHGLPVLGEIPRPSAPRRHRHDNAFVVRNDPESGVADGYRMLRAAIESLIFEKNIRSLQITSAREEERKALVLANLAVALARIGIEVTVVSGDLRHPFIDNLFGLPDDVGLTSLLRGEVPTEKVVQRLEDEANLTLIPAGPPVESPSDLLTSGRLTDVLSDIRDCSTAVDATSLVLIDSPPVLRAADALVIGRAVDATLLVATAKSSSRRALERAEERLRQNNAHIIGTVLIGVD
jgi:capsular exopolysaccharide synthesis family protein